MVNLERLVAAVKGQEKQESKFGQWEGVKASGLVIKPRSTEADVGD